MMLFFSLISASWGLVKLATPHGEIEVIPFFEHLGMSHPVSSPTSLSGRAVAAYFNLPPGYLHAWIPENATEAELKAFAYKECYGPLLLQRWKVDVMRVPGRVHGGPFTEVELRFIDFERNPSPAFFSKLPLWSKIKHLSLVAKTEKDANMLLSKYSLPEGLRKAFSKVEKPLIERVMDFFASNNLNSDSHIYQLVLTEMCTWAIVNYQYFPLNRMPTRLHPSTSYPQQMEGLLQGIIKHGWGAYFDLNIPTVRLCFPHHEELFNAEAPLLAPSWRVREILLIQNLKHANVPLNPGFIESTMNVQNVCQVLVAMHLKTEHLLVLNHPIQTPMCMETREFLREHAHTIPTRTLLQVGFYDIVDVIEDPLEVFNLMMLQSLKLIEAHQSGFMALAGRVIPQLPPNISLSNAPWQLLTCFLRLNKDLDQVIPALFEIPDSQVRAALTVEIKQWLYGTGEDCFKFITPHLEKAMKSNNRLILTLLFQIHPDHLIKHLCIEYSMRYDAIRATRKFIMALRDQDCNQQISKFDLGTLWNWVSESKLEFTDLFGEWHSIAKTKLEEREQAKKTAEALADLQLDELEEEGDYEDEESEDDDS